MKRLMRVSLVQFYLHEAVDIEVDGSTAFLGPNGSGKSSTLDAIQIAMLGGNQQYARFNTQSVSSKQRRTLAGYCLGMLRNPEKDSEVIGRARDEARTYIILVFSDGTEPGTMSAGLCIEADIESNQHEVKGLFILPGQSLNAADCLIFDGENQRPIPYPDFREFVRERSKKIGRTPTLTDKSSEYVSELLYALNGERMPDARRFMSAFVKSMTLKNVDSIDQFVREYVIEPNPVDIASFRKQVDQFISLRDLIRKTKARISRLTGILVDYDRAHSAERRIASLEAVKAIFNVEWTNEKIDDQERKIETLCNQIKIASDKAELAKRERDIKQQEVTELKIRLQTDQTEQSRLRIEEQIRSRQELLEAYQNPEIARANRIINALRELILEEKLQPIRSQITVAVSKLDEARNERDPGVAVAQTLRKIDSELIQIQTLVQVQSLALTKKQNTLAEEIEATRRQISAVNLTGRKLNDGAAQLLQLLDHSKMKAQPISALASIADLEWAPALEAYLGGDRDALVVTTGNTHDAVKILRDARRKDYSIDGAAIVQPNHLRNVDTATKSHEYAVGLIKTQNDTARRFLWQKFGNMRLVDTEAELEKFPRAITRDGMLSQGGLTKSIKIAQLNDLRMGKNFENTSHLSRHIAELQGQLDSLANRIKKLDTFIKTLPLQDASNEDDAVTKITEAIDFINLSKLQLSSLDVSHLDKIREKIGLLELEHKRLDNEHTNNDRLAAGLEEQIKICTLDKNSLEKQLPSIREIEKETLNNKLIDLQMIDEIKDEIERAEIKYDARIADAERKITHNHSRLKTAEERASLELSRYVLEERLDVQLPDMKWRDRFCWASEEKLKLTETHLQNYETEAEHARLAAEETLRSDIAMSLNDRFKEMELERRERNKILESCPAFTGGERYRFTSTVVSHYDSLVRYINQIAKNEQNLSLFSDGDGDINITLRELVETAAETGNAGAILDYRQFFTFDLDILVDGKRVDRMSNRQGAGSNGEHIAPMYVAAGAALAKAYRLHNRKGQKSGIGLICLDEAFHGMDTTNAIATARFLQSIGLQLIMAGPELERTKLAPITQTIYDLDREGLDLLMIRTTLKPKANELMVSDMPDENPQVMMEAYRQLGLDTTIAQELTKGKTNQ